MTKYRADLCQRDESIAKTQKEKKDLEKLQQVKKPSLVQEKIIQIHAATLEKVMQHRLGRSHH